MARQLKKMQEMAVSQPSKSPWSNPVVLVRKKNSSHRFCIDYCILNSAMKADTYPLPRIDDLLNQLGKSQHWTLLQVFGTSKLTGEDCLSTPQRLFEF